MENNPTQQPEQIDPTQTPQSPFRRWLPTIIGITIVVLAVGGFSAWQFFQTQEEGVAVPKTINEAASIQIEWQEPEKQSGKEVFAEFAKKKLQGVRIHSQEFGDQSTCSSHESCLNVLFGWSPSGYSDDDVYLLGKVTSEKYNGAYLYLVETGIFPLSFAYRFRMLLLPSNELVYLGKYSNSLPQSDQLQPENYSYEQFFVVDNSTIIPDLHPPKEIAIPDSPLRLLAKPSPHYLISEWARFTSVLFTDDVWGPIYEGSKSRDIGIKLKDGTVYLYQLETPFLSFVEDEESYYGIPARHTLSATTIATGVPVGKNEFYTIGSSYAYTCGGGVSYYINDYGLPSTAVEYARTPGNQTLFAYPEDSYALQNFYRNNLRITVFRYESPDATYEDFVAIDPMFFWEDPFGRWIEIRNTKILTVAECGGGATQSPIEPL